MSLLNLAQYYQCQIITIEDDGVLLECEGHRIHVKKHQIVKTHKVGDMVNVFTYMNHEKTLTASMMEPIIDAERAGFVKVVETKPKLGVFVDVGLDKDMLVSVDDMPFMKNTWPQIGDVLCCILKAGKNQITAKPLTRFQMQAHFKPQHALYKGETVKAYVVQIAEEGINLLTEMGHEIFVYYKHTRSTHRFGEPLEVTITVVKDQQQYNGTLIRQKETMIDEDAKRILAALESSEGTLSLSDKSSPDEIYKLLNMSKAAFKRAIGTLYKQKLIKILPDKITRINDKA